MQRSHHQERDQGVYDNHPGDSFNVLMEENDANHLTQGQKKIDYRKQIAPTDLVVAHKCRQDTKVHHRERIKRQVR